MKIYVVITVFAGCLNDVQGFTDEGKADLYLASKKQELGINEGYEEESEHDVQLREVDITVYPTSVAIREEMF